MENNYMLQDTEDKRVKILLNEDGEKGAGKVIRQDNGVMRIELKVFDNNGQVGVTQIYPTYEDGRPVKNWKGTLAYLEADLAQSMAQAQSFVDQLRAEQEADTDTSLPEEVKQFVATQPNFWQRLKFAVTGKTGGIDTDANADADATQK